MDDEHACRAGFMGAGATAGLITGSVGAPITGGLSIPALMGAGAALGLGVGYLACSQVAPWIKQKVESGQFMTESETHQAIKAMAIHSRTNDPKQAATLLAAVRGGINQDKRGGNAVASVQKSFSKGFGNHLNHPHHQSRTVLAAAGGGSKGKKG